METVAALLENPALATFVNEQGWVWPVSEIVHFLGMALLFGTVGLLDLRMLGLARALPVRDLHRLVPWGVFGFALTVVTGFVFVCGDVSQTPIMKFNNLAFQLKMAAMLCAGVNVLAFYATGISRAAERVGPGEDAPVAAKVVALMSLSFWIAVIYFGRMIMYEDDLYVRHFF